MEDLYICYHIQFNLSVKKRNGKTYKSHSVLGMGADVRSALSDVHFKLKRSKTVILEIHSVKFRSIAFALSGGQPVKLRLDDHLPKPPEDLNIYLKHLPI